MSQSSAANLIHVVFSTKNRIEIIDDNISLELFSYITTILKNNGCDVYKIGDTTNHVHILFSLSKNHSLSDIIKEIKHDTSRWIKNKEEKYQSFYWQSGYGAFSISANNKKIVCNYIVNQKKHHERFYFKHEFKKLLVKYDIKFDEKYLWD